MANSLRGAFFAAAFVVCFMPALSFGIGYSETQDMYSDIIDNSNLAGKDLSNVDVPGSIAAYCANNGFDSDCTQLSVASFNEWFGSASALVSLAFLGLIFVCGSQSMKNRDFLVSSYVFLRSLTMVFLPSILIANAILFCVAGGSLEIAVIRGIHTGFFLSAAILALTAAFFVLKAGSRLLVVRPISVSGFRISETDWPELTSFVSGIAETLNTPAPDNIIIGIEPGFWVTESLVQVFNENVSIFKNRTLYVSLSSARLLNQSEMKAIIGHELAHFTGEDTQFSIKFNPVFRQLNETLSLISLKDDDSFRSYIMIYPAFAVINFLQRCFTGAEANISRTREFRADRIGASISSSTSMISALFKMVVATPYWSSAVEYVKLKKEYFNISDLYFDISQSELFEIDQGRILRGFEGQSMHPTDSHPRTLDRISALGIRFDPSEVAKIASLDLDAESISPFHSQRFEEMLSFLYILQESEMNISRVSFNKALFIPHGGGRRVSATL